MTAADFAKGMGVGLVVGSAVGMSVVAANRRLPPDRRGKVGRTVSAVGEFIENIGSNLGM